MRRGKRQRREPIEISAEEARQDAPPPTRAPKSRRTPLSLVLLYGAVLTLMALALWAFLLLVRF